MRLTFFGAAREVGRSCIMVEAGNTKVLLDSGVKLGEREEYPIIKDDELKDVDAILLSHAHLDHSGYLPHIYSTKFSGDFYTTKPTVELTNVLISDYMRISEPENVTKQGLKDMVGHAKMVEYREELRFKDMSIRFIPAGHILGSAMILISSGKEKLLYTGDVNPYQTKLFTGAEMKNLEADTLISESTYGGEKDAFKSERDIIKEMSASIKETINQGGKVIIPSFAVGRAQEVLLLLDDNINSGNIPKVPIYMDGMINKAMRIHRHNVIYCRKELQSRILMSEYDPFKSPNFVVVDKKSVRAKAISDDESCIIVTTSGMLSGGPVMTYLQKMAGNPLNKMILVGYQAEGTQGRDLQEGAREITINNSKVKVDMKVETYHLSAHADRRGLEGIMGKVSGLKSVFLVHGEKEKAESLREGIKGKYDAKVPGLGESFST